MLEAVASTARGPGLRCGLRSALAFGEKAVAALEFGLIAPVMALLVIGVFDISRATILWEQVWSASRSIAESASTLALPVAPGAPNAMTWQNAQLALSASFAEIPWLADGIVGRAGNTANGSFSAVLTSVNYALPSAACSSGSNACCPSGGTTYCALVVWSKAYVHAGFNDGSNVIRPCGTVLSQQASGTPITPLSISTGQVSNGLSQAGITVPDPFFVADVSLNYKPYFFNFITGAITLSATSYVPVRTSNPGSLTQYATLYDDGDPNASNGSVCSVTPAPPA